MKEIIFIATCIIMNLSCCGQKSVKNKPVPMDNAKQPIHIFKDSNGTILGNVYVNYIANSKDVFNLLTIIKEKDNKLDTLYKIENNKFIIPHTKKIDLTVFKDQFYGYKIILKKSNYIVISYLRNKGTNVSDDITIEWNELEKMFEVMKTP